MLVGGKFKLSQRNSDFTLKVNSTPLERVINLLEFKLMNL